MHFVSRAFAVGLLGALFIVSQVLILREFLLVFHGNEFSIGIVLGNWFLLEALGSWLAGRRTARSRSPLAGFLRLQVALSLLLPATLVAILASRYLPGISPWEALSLVQIGLVSLLLLTPLALGNGAAFVYACRLLSGGEEPWRSPGAEAGAPHRGRPGAAADRGSVPVAEDQRAPGMVYGLESAGAFLGGLAFTFLLVTHLSPMGTAFLLGLLNMTSALFLLRPAPAVRRGSAPGTPAGPARGPCENGESERGGERGAERSAPEGSPPTAGSRQALSGARPDRPFVWRRLGVVLLFSFFLFGLLSPLSDRIQRWATQIRWHPLKLIRSTESVYGNITALAVDGQDVLYLNGVPSIFLPYPDITAVEELVHLPLLAHPDPADVLFVGGGVGGALAEAQKHPLDRLVYAELDPVLIREVEKVRPEESAAELGEPRTRVVYEDGRFYLRGTEERFHVILCHLPDASTLQLNRFFTREFFDLASRHLHPDGVLAFAMPGSSSYLSRELLRLNACVLETLRSAFPHVRVIPGERNLFLASPAGKLEAVSAAVLEERLEQRRIEAAVIGPRYLRYQLDAGREKWLYRELASVTPIRINRDLSPALLYYFISWRNAELQPFLRNPVSWFGKLSVGWLLAILAAIALGVLIRVAVRRGRPRFAVSFSILGSGFAGMAVELVVILAFQSVYGYLYQWIGLLIAVFMAGLAAGSALATWRLDRVQSSYRIFCIIEGVLTSLLLLSAWALPAVQEFFLGRASLAPAPQITFVALNLLAGLLVGSEFPLANRAAAFRTGPGTSEVAGKLYALDLAGAWLGTFLVSLLLVPLLGLGSTLLAAAGLKVLNLACLACRR